MLPNYNQEIHEIEEDILSGKIVSGQLLKDCIIRHRKDLKEGGERGISFNCEIGQDVLDFASELNGYNGQPAVLFWWQKLELYYFFGWRRGKNRRYKIQYLSMARKNQKTITRPPKFLYHLLEECGSEDWQEYAPEIYISATKEDQAKICFDDFVTIINYNEDLKDLFKINATAVSSADLHCKITFLTSNPKTADGTRPSYYVIDEYHEFDEDGMLNKLKTGAINRVNSISEIITTRGTDKSKPCFIREQKVFLPILKGTVKNDDVFVMVFAPDEGDEIELESTWYKANPNLGTTINIDTFRQEYVMSKLQGEEAINSFKTLNLNMWVDAPKVIIKDEDWMQGRKKVSITDFYGKTCFGGFDMGLKDDFAALCLVFPGNSRDDFENELDFEKNFKCTVFWRFWITSESIQKRVNKGLSSIRDWVADGHVSICEGNYNSYTQIQNDIVELSNSFNIESIGFDPAYIGSLAEGLLMNDIQPIEIPQRAWILKKNDDGTTINIGLSPCKQWFKELIWDRRITHNGDPVMRWMVQNIVQTTDINGNIYFTKDAKKSRDKIDGVSAMVNALSVIRNAEIENTEIDVW